MLQYRKITYFAILLQYNTIGTTPGRLNLDGHIDLNDKLGRNLYNRVVEPLKVPFDGTLKNIHLLQNQLKVRVKKSGWDKRTGNILDVANTKGDIKNILYKYGCLSMDEIKAATSSYCITSTTTRAAQITR